MPTVARLIGHDFTENGVSVVNVGHTGLRRFAKIFQRNDPERDGVLDVPVACIADLDVMPDCAPVIIGKVKEGEAWPDTSKRRWRAKGDFADGELEAHREAIRVKASGQKVETFVADEWTLEYDLAYAGLAEDVWVSAYLAGEDDKINAGTKTHEAVEADARDAFAELTAQQLQTDELASRVYALFTTGAKASKAVAAQYLAERLERQHSEGTLTAEKLKSRLPSYLVSAIVYVCPAPADEAAAAPAQAQAAE